MSSTGPSLADTHCHLTANVFDRDRDQVVERALEEGIQWIVVPGMDLESSREAVALADKFPNVYAAVGVHPHNADGWNESIAQEFRELTQSENVVAIGEIGLDYYRNISSRKNQLYAFRSQLELAAKTKLPVIIHNREATDDVTSTLLGWVAEIDSSLQSRAGVLHAFSADLETAQDVVRAGFYVGIAGPISYKNSSKLQNVASKIPTTRILTETDSPFLTPHPKRNRRNEPANVVVVAKHLSRIIKRDYDTTVKITSQNAAKLFGWLNGNN